MRIYKLLESIYGFKSKYWGYIIWLIKYEC
jgi:hypothetical protein